MVPVGDVSPIIGVSGVRVPYDLCQWKQGFTDMGGPVINTSRRRVLIHWCSVVTDQKQTEQNADAGIDSS